MDTSLIVAVLDANVLYPRYVRDTLLRMAEADLYSARWSADILAELSRNLLKDRATPAQVEWLHEMRVSFPTAEVTGYQAQIDAMKVDPKDRHVAAAAVVANAGLIVMDNLQDFPQIGRAPLKIEALSADAFLTRLVNVSPARVADTMKLQAADYRKPPRTPLELVDILGKRVPQFASAAKLALADSSSS